MNFRQRIISRPSVRLARVDKQDLMSSKATTAAEFASPCPGASLGKAGEDIAIKLYESLGFKLLARNWRAGRFAEVDLILRGTDGLLVFVEVKTRTAAGQSLDPAGAGFASVGWQKQKKIITAARIFMSTRVPAETPCRFDVVVICCAKAYPGHISGELTPDNVIRVVDAFSA